MNDIKYLFDPSTAINVKFLISLAEKMEERSHAEDSWFALDGLADSYRSDFPNQAQVFLIDGVYWIDDKFTKARIDLKESADGWVATSVVVPWDLVLDLAKGLHDAGQLIQRLDYYLSVIKHPTTVDKTRRPPQMRSLWLLLG